MIELGVGFHPELTGRENVFLNAAIHGLSGRRSEAIYRRHRRAIPGSSTSSTCRSRTTRRACTCGWGSRSRRISIPTSCSSTRSSPSATPTSSSGASTRSSGSWSRARPSSSSRTHPKRCGRSAAGPASWIRENWPSTAMSKAVCTSTTRCCIEANTATRFLPVRDAAAVESRFLNRRPKPDAARR